MTEAERAALILVVRLGPYAALGLLLAAIGCGLGWLCRK